MPTSTSPSSSDRRGWERLTEDLIKKWAPEKALQLIHVAQALKIIQFHFCRPIYLRGVCPLECEICRSEIADLFRLGQAEKPAALLAWLAKDHAARQIERLILASKDFPAPESDGQVYDSLFSQPEPNLIEELMRQYVQQTLPKRKENKAPGS